MKQKTTSDGTKGGLLKGKPHYDKDGKPLGGIKAIVTDAGDKPVELEGGEVIINKEASKKHWRELSRINQSAGNGVPIGPPEGADEDPEEYKDGGNIIEFNPNHVPNKWIVKYATEIKSKHPEIWKLGGNIFGNEAYRNLLRVSERGYWLDSERWMYIKWRSYVARHKKDFRIEGVVAMLKWCDKVDKGWAYMKDLIDEKIKKIESKSGWKHKGKKMMSGGNVKNYAFVESVTTNGEKVFKLYDHVPTNKEVFDDFKKIKDENGKPITLAQSDIKIEKFTSFNRETFLKQANKVAVAKFGSKIDDLDELIFSFDKNNMDVFAFDAELENDKEVSISVTDGVISIEEKTEMKGGGNLSKTPAPASERIKGSKTNPKGTAKDSQSAEKIKFDDNTITSIQSLIDEHNEKHPSKKITLAVAKAVVRRGMGAYSSTHRPTITGGKPNSRTAWGLARLKAFIHKAQTGKSKSGNYSQDNDLFEELGIEVSKFSHGGNIFKNEKTNITYMVEQRPDGRWTVYSESENWEKTDDYAPSGLASKEDAISLAKLSAGLTKEDDPEEYFMSNEFGLGGSIELAKGIKAEYEHAKTIAKFKRKGVSIRDVARSIAKDHLKEDPKYYSKLEKMEGQKFEEGGLITNNGGTAKVGDIGVLTTRKGNIQIQIKNITEKWVIFNDLTDGNKRKDNPIDKFIENYQGPIKLQSYVDSTSGKEQTGIPDATAIKETASTKIPVSQGGTKKVEKFVEPEVVFNPELDYQKLFTDYLDKTNPKHWEKVSKTEFFTDIIKNFIQAADEIDGITEVSIKVLKESING